MKIGNDITLVWSFRNRLDKLKKSIETADRYTSKDVKFCLIDAASDEETIKKLRIFCNKLKNRQIRICESLYRSSLSEAWNLGIILSSTRYVIFASSDVEFKSNKLIKELQKMINAGFEYVLIDNHAVFMIDKRLVTKIGWFDERYGIGPHFDTDYLIRCTEKKCRFIIIPNRNYYIHYDSQKTTMLRRIKEVKNRLPMHDKTNEKFFKEKWLSKWEGWDNGIHPPTNISEVKRQLLETDPHSLFTKKYKNLYKSSLSSRLYPSIKRIQVKILQRLSK